MIFPNTEQHILVPDKISTKTPYVGLLINYQYFTNKRGEFGLIVEYGAFKPELDYLDEFAK